MSSVADNSTLESSVGVVIWPTVSKRDALPEGNLRSATLSDVTAREVNQREMQHAREMAVNSYALRKNEAIHFLLRISPGHDGRVALSQGIAPERRTKHALRRIHIVGGTAQMMIRPLPDNSGKQR